MKQTTCPKTVKNKTSSLQCGKAKTKHCIGKHATIELQNPQGVNMIRTHKDHPENNPNILSIATKLLGVLLELSLHLPIYSRNAFKKITSCLKSQHSSRTTLPPIPSWFTLAKKTSICKASLNRQRQTPKKIPRPAKRAFDSETKEDNPSEDTPREAVHLMAGFVRWFDLEMVAFTSLSWL